VSNLPPQPGGWAAQVIALITWLRANPVIWLDAVKALLAVGVVLGWWAAPGEPITDLASAAAAVAFAALTAATRRRVTPAP
jgi:hypothetical protein